MQSGEQFVQDDAECVDIGSSIDVGGLTARLFGSHILERAHDRAELRRQRLVGQPPAGRLGDAKVNYLRHGAAIIGGYQYVRRFEISVYNSLMMGMLHGMANGYEQFEALTER